MTPNAEKDVPVHVVADPECELHQEFPTKPDPEKRCPTCRVLPPEGRCEYDGDRCVRCGANWFDQALRDDDTPCRARVLPPGVCRHDGGRFCPRGTPDCDCPIPPAKQGRMLSDEAFHD